MQNGKIEMLHHLEEYVVKNPLTQHFSFYAPFSVQVRIKKKKHKNLPYRKDAFVVSKPRVDKVV